MAEQKDNPKKEAFVGQQDRPDVQLNPDEPITNLRVRDLAALLGQPAKVGDKLNEKPIVAEHAKHFAPEKYVVKDMTDAKWSKDLKDHIVDTIFWPPPFPIPRPDPEIRQAIDLLVKEVAQLRQEVNQLKR